MLIVAALLGAACGNSATSDPVTHSSSRDEAAATHDGTSEVGQVIRGVPLESTPAVVRTLSEILAEEAKRPTRIGFTAPAHHAPSRLETSGNPPASSSSADSPLVLEAPLAPSPAPASSFAASDDSGWIPPDTNGAVGPNHLVVAHNGRVLFQNKTGTEISRTTLAGFFASVNNTGDVFDPLVRYDPFQKHFILIAVADRNSPASAVLIATSQTTDPTGAWNFFKIDADPTDLNWADFPKLGFNKNWIVVTANMLTGGDPDSDGKVPFAIAAAGEESAWYVCDKAALYAGTSSCRRFGQPSVAFASAAVEYDANLSTEYLAHTMSSDTNGQGTIAIDTITGAVGSEVVTIQAATVTIPANWSQNGSTLNFAPQSGSTELIETDFFAAIATLVYRNGSLFGAQTAYLPVSSPTRSAIQWWQAKPTGSLQQWGRVDDSTGHFFYAFPSFSVNKYNDALLGYARFSASEFASGAYSFRAGTDAAGTMRADTLLKAGEGPYFKDFGSGRNRWGDYSATIVDPSNDRDLWTIQEYVAPPSGSNLWGTWWGKIVPPSNGDRTEGGSAAATGTACNSTSETPPKAYDNLMTSISFSKWCVTSAPSTSIPVATMYDFSGTTAFAINKYTITTGNDQAPRDPKDWTFQGCSGSCTVGSDTGWVTLDTRTGQFAGASRFQTNTYTFANTTAFQQYRLRCTANNGDTSRLQVTEIQMFDGSFTSESDAQFCSRLGKNCGSMTGTDNCGMSRTVSSCGACTAPQTCGGGGTANVCGGGTTTCTTPYSQSNCLTYTLGTVVSDGGHNWLCSNGNCANCASTSTCAPGATGCPWGVVWTDQGPCG